jgi:NitT/TauT family transport system permease protein
MKRFRSAISAVLPPVVVLLAAGAACEAWVRMRHVPEYLVPRPTAVVEAAWSRDGALLGSLGKTAAGATAGFLAALIVGTAFAVLLAWSRLVRRALGPYTVFFQTVPVVAIAPLLVVWFGAGIGSVSICAFIVSVFPVIANATAGMLGTDPALLDLFRLYGAGSVATMSKLRFPHALPQWFTGLRVAAGLSVVGAIVGEFSAAELGENPGLGVVIMESARNGRTADVFAAVIASAGLGLAMLGAVAVARRVTLRGREAPGD